MNHQSSRSSLAFLVAAIALSCWDSRLCLFADILRERTSYVITLFELALIVPADISLVAAGIDQLSLCFFGHYSVSFDVLVQYE